MKLSMGLRMDEGGFGTGGGVVLTGGSKLQCFWYSAPSAIQRLRVSI